MLIHKKDLVKSIACTILRNNKAKNKSDGDACLYNQKIRVDEY